MGNDLNRSIKITIDGSAAAQGIAPVEAAIQKLEQRLAALNRTDKNYAAQSAKLKKDLDAKNKTLQSYKQKVKETEQVLNNLSGASYNKLIAVQKVVRNQLRDLTPGTEKYNAVLLQNKRVSEAVAKAQRDMRVEIGCQGTTMGKAVGTFNKYAAVITAGVAAITGVALKLNQIRDKRDEREDTKADVKALTGLDDESVNWLEQQAKRLSTTTTDAGIRIKQSATEILDAYKLVGSAKPDLLEDKEALAAVTEQTLILASASGLDLKSAVDAVTLSMNQYGASSDQASRYANVLAAGSKYGAAAVDSVTSAVTKSGVAAANAGVPIEQLVGTIETLAEKGIKDEIAGTGLKKFFLTLQTGADATNPKVVGLATALENLSKKQLSAAQIKTMFGEEGYNVASVLINETEQVKHYTEAVTGSSVAVEQANIKSQTASALRAQARNKMNELGIELMNRLSPSILTVTNGLVTWSNKTVTLISFLIKHSRIISSLLIGIAAYTAAIKIKIMWDKLHKAAVDAGTFSMKSFNTVLKLNPWGIAIAGITALISYFTIFRQKTDEATSSNYAFNASLEEVKKASERMDNIRQKNNNRRNLNDRQLQDLRSSAAQELQMKEDMITKETILLNQSIEKKEAILGDESKMRDKNYRKQAADLQEQEDIHRSYIASMQKDSSELQKIVDSIKPKKVVSGNGNEDKEADKQRKAALDQERILYTQQQAALKKLYASGEDEKLSTQKQYDAAQLKLKRDYYTKIIAVSGKGTSEAADAENQIADLQLQEKKLKIEHSIAEENELYAQQQRELKEAYINQEDENLNSEAAYNEAKEQLAIMHLQRMLDISGLDATRQKTIEEQLLDFKMKCINEEMAARDKARQEDENRDRNSTQRQQEAYKKRVTTYKQYGIEVGNALGNVIAGQENAVASFADTMIDIVFDVLAQIVEAEIIKATATATGAVARASAEAFATPDSVLTFGASGAARAAILTGLIMGALAAAKVALKSMIPGKSSGVSNSSDNTSQTKSATVSVRQFAKGNYNVIGQDDGRAYQDVPYIGPAPTGIVRRTSLISESGAELIINTDDLSRLQRHINYPLVIDAIQDARNGRVPQRATGNYESIEKTSTVNLDSSQSHSDESNINRLISELRNLIAVLKNLKAYVVLRDIHEAEDLDRKAKETFTRTKK